MVKQSNMDATAKLDSAGRLVVPVAYRKVMGLKAGDEVVLRLEQNEMRVFSREAAVARAKALVKKHFPGDEPLSDRLIAERRGEAAREDEDLNSGS